MRVIPIHTERQIQPGDSLVSLFEHTQLYNDDVVVIAQKVVSKAEGRMIRLDDISPSLLARGIAIQYGKDARIVELILLGCHHIVRMQSGVIITRLRSGHVCANSGVDTSNVPPGFALMLPIDCDVSASTIRRSIHDTLGVQVGVIISDTVGRPFRLGQTDVALGCSGVMPLLDCTGQTDTYGHTLRVTVTAIADQLAAAAELSMTKTGCRPAVIIRGVSHLAGPGSAQDIIRTYNDMFGG